jgi:hypothetical protein
MKRWVIRIVVGILAVVIALAALRLFRSVDLRFTAAAVEKLGDAPSKVVLYSLDPIRLHGQPRSAELFHDFDVLGHAEITDRNEQQALFRELAWGVRENGGDVFACFNPRHALHVEQSGRSIDLVICFQCRSVSAYGFQQKNFLTGASPQNTFDASLRRHHLPLAPWP